MDHSSDIWDKITAAADSRILMLDGAMGTMLQKQSLEENDFRGERFADWPSPLQGNNDLLVLTKPSAVEKVHHAFLEAGADLIETNSFNATSISQADYDMAELAPEIARASAQLARKCADEWTAKTPEKPRAVLGSVGPMNKTLSISPKVEDPGYRDVTFDEVKDSYIGQMRAMVDIVDAILIETVFDTLNCKAAIAAARAVFAEVGYEKPILISGTITDRSGRTLSGQTPEAFWTSIAQMKCALILRRCPAWPIHVLWLSLMQVCQMPLANMMKHLGICSAKWPLGQKRDWSISLADVVALRQSTLARLRRRWLSQRRAK